MNVVYDLLGNQNRDHGERGIARYVQQLAIAIEAHDPEFVTTYLIHDHLPVPGSLEPLIATGKTMLASEAAAKPPIGGGVFVAGSVMEMGEPSSRVLPRWARGSQWQLMAVLYDLIPHRFPEIYLRDARTRAAVIARGELLGSFDQLLSISQASATDAAEILGTPASRLTVIGAGADDRFAPPTLDRASITEKLRSSLGVTQLNEGFVLFPTGIEPRKNNDLMLEAYAALPARTRQQHQLVMVSRLTPVDQADLEARADELGIHDDLILTDFVSDADLVHLNQAAELVVFPSIYEGFGLPVLEARRCGAATLCSDTSSLREVQPDPTARFDPNDGPALAELLERTLNDPKRVQQLRDAPIPEFTWERAAQTTIEVGQQLMAQHRPRRPRLAIISPLPPAASGIADYLAGVIPHLTPLVDTTVYVEKSDPVVPIDGVQILPIAQFDSDEDYRGAYDRVLYQLGNSEYHVEAYRLLQRRGGAVELHDARLTGLFYQLQQAYPDELPNQKMGDMLMAWYPFKYRNAVELMPSIWPETADRFGILMTRPVVAAADQVLTHSRYAADLVRLDGGAAPTTVVPLACPALSPQTSPAPLDSPVIATFGIVAEVKQPAKLVSAMKTVVDRIPQAQLRIVGSIDDTWSTTLHKLAADAGIEANLALTGRLDPAEFQREMEQTTIAVQLREFSNGESSGVIPELLSRGIPTIATAIGANRELPSPAVTLVEPNVAAEQLGRQILRLTNNAEIQAARASALDHAANNGLAAFAERLLAALDLPTGRDASA